MAASLKHWEETNTLYLFTSLTGGSSLILSRTSRLETILLNARIPFTHIDTATDESAKRLFQRRAKNKKLPLLVKEGFVLGTFEEIEEWNEYGELKEMIGEVAEGGERSVSAAPATKTMKPVSFDREMGIKPSIDSIMAGGMSPGAMSPSAKIGDEKKLENVRPTGMSQQNSMTKSLAEEAAAKAKSLKSTGGKKKTSALSTPKNAPETDSENAKEPLSPSAVPLPTSPTGNEIKNDANEIQAASNVKETPEDTDAMPRANIVDVVSPSDKDVAVDEPELAVPQEDTAKSSDTIGDVKTTDKSIPADESVVKPTGGAKSDVTETVVSGTEESIKSAESQVDPDLSLPTTLTKPAKVIEITGQASAQPSFIAEGVSDPTNKVSTKAAEKEPHVVKEASSSSATDGNSIPAEKDDDNETKASNDVSIESIADTVANSAESAKESAAEVAKDVKKSTEEVADMPLIEMTESHTAAITDDIKSTAANLAYREKAQEPFHSIAQAETNGLGLTLGDSRSGHADTMEAKLSDAATTVTDAAADAQSTVQEKVADAGASVSKTAVQIKETTTEAVASATLTAEETAAQVQEKAKENLAAVKESISPIDTQTTQSKPEGAAVMKDTIDRPSTPTPRETATEDPKTPEPKTPSKLNPVTPQVAPSKQFKMDKKETKPDASPKPIHDQFMHFFF